MTAAIKEEGDVGMTPFSISSVMEPQVVLMNKQ